MVLVSFRIRDSYHRLYLVGSDRDEPTSTEHVGPVFWAYRISVWFGSSQYGPIFSRGNQCEV